MLSVFLAWSALRTRPARTFFSVAGIALGIATAVAILTLDQSTVANKISKKTETFARVDLEVRPADPLIQPGEALERLRQTHGVARVAALVFESVQFKKADGTPATTMLAALDPVARTEPAFEAYRIAEGTDISSTETTEEKPQILVGFDLAETSGLKLNDTIFLASPRSREENAKGCVDGELVTIKRGGEGADAARILPPPVECKIVGILDRYHLGRQSGGSIIIIPFTMLPRIYGEQALSPIFWLAKDEKVPAEELKTALTPDFAYQVERTALIGEAADERAFRNGVRISGVLALLLGLFVIFHTLSMSLVERVREIAILNAIGATRGQVGASFFVEAAMIAFGGAITGIGTGLGLAKLALLAGYTTLGRIGPVHVFDISWGPVLAVAGTGMVVAMLGSIFPLMKARSIYPARVLADRDLGKASDLFRGMNLFMFAILAIVLPLLYFFAVPVLGEQSRETARVLVLGGLLFMVFLAFLLLAPRGLAYLCTKVSVPFERAWPLEGFLSARAMIEGIPRVATSAAVLALVGAALITVKGITSSLRNESAVWGETIVNKVFFECDGPIPRDRVEKLAGLPGVRGFESLGARIPSPFLIYGLTPEDTRFAGPLANTDVAARFSQSNSLILSKPLAHSLKLEVGGEVAVAISRGTPVKCRIVAISDDLGFFPPVREYGIVHSDFLKKHYCLVQDVTNRFVLHVQPGADHGAVASAVRASLAEFPPLKVNSGIERRNYAIQDIDRDFRLFDLILILVAALAGVGVLNALLLAAFERRKEIGVMKAIGMTSRQLGGTVFIEAVATGIVGGVFGVALGVSFVFLVIDALARLTGLPLAIVLNPVWPCAALGGAVILSIAAAVIPILRANRFSAAEAVRYE